MPNTIFMTGCRIGVRHDGNDNRYLIEVQSFHRHSGYRIKPLFRHSGYRIQPGTGPEPWFDMPFDRLMAPSDVEGLTTLSKTEGESRFLPSFRPPSRNPVSIIVFNPIPHSGQPRPGLPEMIKRRYNTIFMTGCRIGVRHDGYQLIPATGSEPVPDTGSSPAQAPSRDPVPYFYYEL